MAKSYEEIQKQIAKLQQEADKLRQKEVQEVIGRIKEAIEHYSLSPADLFGARAGSGSAAKKRAGKPKQVSQPRYRDEAGHTWTGHGKRPNWFKDALAAGKTPEDLLIK